MLRFLSLAIVLMALVACGKDDVKLEKRADRPRVLEGTYRTAVVEQPDYRDYHAKEKLQSEIVLQGEQVTYIAYKDGKELSRKTGTYDEKRRVFILAKPEQDPEDHPLADITPTGFRMQNGRVGLSFSKVQ